MANTTNFGWETPDDTDLVKDGASAMRTLGNAIDTSLVDLKGGTTGQVLSKASNTDMDFTWVAQDDSNAIQNALLTTTGDTIYASAASTPARLAIGSNGQILTVAGGLPTWAAAPATNANWSQVAATSLSSTTTTVSGISGADKLLIHIHAAILNTAAQELQITFNGDTGANYNYCGGKITFNSSYSAGIGGVVNSIGASYIDIATTGSNASSSVGAYILLSGGNSAGQKIFNGAGAATTGSGGNGQIHRTFGGWWNNSATISSVSITTAGGSATFSSGTIYVYKSA